MNRYCPECELTFPTERCPTCGYEMDLSFNAKFHIVDEDKDGRPRKISIGHEEYILMDEAVRVEVVSGIRGVVGGLGLCREISPDGTRLPLHEDSLPVGVGPYYLIAADRRGE